MTNEFNGNGDAQLRVLFADLAPPVPDDGFSSRVVRQVRATLWKRRAVLAVAAFAGLVLAAPAVTEMLVYASSWLQGLISQALLVVGK